MTLDIISIISIALIALNHRSKCAQFAPTYTRVADHFRFRRKRESALAHDAIRISTKDTGFFLIIG